jgi:hypothetical protein
MLAVAHGIVVVEFAPESGSVGVQENVELYILGTRIFGECALSFLK